MIQSVALFRSQVMNGTTPIQLKAKAIRSKVIMTNASAGAGGKSVSVGSKTPSLFKEPNFQYLGDTVVIWNLKEYLDQPKWREDALRRSLKRRQREESLAMTSASKKICFVSLPGADIKSKSRRKRFRAIVEALYQKSLEENAGTSESGPAQKRLKVS